MDELLTFREALRYLKISRSTLYRFMEAGKLQGYKCGATWRFTKEALQKCLEPETIAA